MNCPLILGVFFASNEGTHLKWVELFEAGSLPSLQVLLFAVLGLVSPQSVKPQEVGNSFSSSLTTCGPSAYAEVLHER